MDHTYKGGISSQSTTFFHTPSGQIADFLHYPLCMGHYYCNSQYKVERTSYDSYLLLYTKRGQGILKVGQVTHHLVPGAVCLIDCYLPHFYQALDHWELEWMHFDGGNSADFFTYLSEDKPFFHTFLKNQTEFQTIWNRLYETLIKKDNIHELLISQDIAQILTLLGLSKSKKAVPGQVHDFMDICLKHIHRHLNENITLNALANRVSLSPFYFTRRFKKETGYTPHRYILISRINLAKFYLKSTADSVKNIGFSCGFNSEHSFCTTFKKEVGLTPSAYRNQPHF